MKFSKDLLSARNKEGIEISPLNKGLLRFVIARSVSDNAVAPVSPDCFVANSAQ